jgi:uncharacterized protein
MEIRDQLMSGLLQFGSILLVGLFLYGLKYLSFGKHLPSQPFLSHVGLQPSPNQIDSRFYLIWIAIILFGILSTLGEFYISGNLKGILMSEESEYGKILKNGFSLQGVYLGLIYCFIQSAAAEELLFRGLIAKKIISVFGLFRGNIFQALFFCLMHSLVFLIMTQELFSFLQIYVFVTSFGLGLLFGYVNYRNNGESILPSWLLHGSYIFASFLTLAAVWPR